MATNPQPIPVPKYVFTAGTPAVADQVNYDQNTLFSVLQGGIGDVHIADQADINGTKLAPNTVTANQIANGTITPTQIMNNPPYVSTPQQGGMRIYYGQVTTSVVGAYASATVTFPSAFTNPVPFVFLTVIDVAGSGTVGTLTSVSSSGFVCSNDNAYPILFNWIALGF